MKEFSLHVTQTITVDLPYNKPKYKRFPFTNQSHVHQVYEIISSDPEMM